jgi:hypothetical protein
MRKYLGLVLAEASITGHVIRVDLPVLVLRCLRLHVHIVTAIVTVG